MSEENASSAGNSRKNRENPAGHLAQYKFKPGQSGNRNGRPKKKPVTEIYERILSNPEHVAMIEAAILKVLKRGQMSMVLVLREMTDRIEGKGTQSIKADVTVNLAEAIAAARKRAAA